MNTTERTYRGDRFKDQAGIEKQQTQPPHDEEAEMVVLGAMMMSGQDALAALRELTETDFYNPAHQHIFRAAREAYEKHRVVDWLTVTDAMRAAGKLGALTVEYLDTLCCEWGIQFVAVTHIRRLRERTVARRVLYAADALVQQAYEYQQSGPELVDVALAQLLEIRRENTSARGAVPAEQHIGDFTLWLHGLRESKALVHGFRWGLPTLDHALGGHAEDDIVLLKAGTGCGKTTLLRQGVLETVRYYHVMGQQEAVAVYLLEGGIRRWYQGAVAWLGRIDKKYLRHGGEAKAKEAGVKDQVQREIGVATAELYELGKAHLLVSRDCRTAKDVVNDVREKLAGGTRFVAVCVDYLQLLQAPGTSLREKTVGAMNALLDLRSEVDFPIIINSQVTVQENGQARAREAEDVENGASTILWIDRGPGERNPDKKRKAKIGNLVTTKVRDDAIPAELPISFDRALLDRARIGELTEGEVAGPAQDH